jgi:hypothetical protein
MAGESMTFTANVKGSFDYKIEYKWTVSGGNIVEGQGTKELSVTQTREMAGEAVTVTVEISGLPKECPNVTSASFVSCPPSMRMIDGFTLEPTRIDKARLDSLFNELRNDPTATATIIEYFHKKTTLREIETKLNKLFAYAKLKDIQTDKIVVFISEAKENLTEFWIIPAGASAYECKDCIRVNSSNYERILKKLFSQKPKK